MYRSALTVGCLRVLHGGANVGAQIKTAFESAQKLRFSRGQFGLELWQRRQCAADKAQIAWAGPAGGDAGQQPLQVIDAAKLLAQQLAKGVVAEQFGDR